MPHDSNSNERSSAKTSNKPPETHLSESEFLGRQQADARKAIAHTLDELKRDVVKAADPRAWMQVHPWVTLGAATIAGFAASAATIPSKDEQALRRLEKLEEALEAKERDVDGNGRVRSGRSRRGSALGRYALRVFQPMIISTLTGFISGKAAAPETPTGGAEPAEAMSAASPDLGGLDSDI